MRIYTFALVTLMCLAGCSGKPPAPTNSPSASPAPNVNNEQHGGESQAQQAEATAPLEEPKKPDWKPFSPPDGHYSVLFPVTPQIFPSDDSSVTNYGVEFKSGRVYMTSESERPTKIVDPAKGLAALRDAQIGTNQQLFDKEISLDGHVGRTFGYVDPDGDVWQIRAFTKGNTVFQAYVMLPKTAYSEDDPDVARFFDSFRIEAAEQGADQRNRTDDDEN